MSDFLALYFESDDDVTGELFAEVSANGFSGKGSAWFDKKSLLETIESFRQYPIPKENPPIIEGGFWEGSGPDLRLKQEHIYISLYPIDSRGSLGVLVRLAQDEWPGVRLNSIHRVVAELTTTYEEVSKFATQFKNLINDENKKVVLNATKT